jgi:hypothetical protein
MRAKTITGVFAWRVIAGFASALACAASAAAPVVVVSTGNPDIDVPAVQAAVDRDGAVTLKGHISFNRPPTVPTATTFAGGLATILVSKEVTISGTRVRPVRFRDRGSCGQVRLCDEFRLEQRLDVQHR